MIISGGEEDIEHFTSKADRLLETVLSTSKGTPIHLIFITEDSSVSTIAKHVESAFARALRERILFNSETWKLVKGRSFRIPKLRVEFVSMASITSRHRVEIEQMKKHFNNYKDWYKMKGDPQWAWMPAAKYNHDLFYLSPFYHIDFPLDKLIVTDTDIEFKFSIDLLYAQFALFSSNHLYSLGPDLTPFYADRLFDYRLLHPETQLGLPGELQGVNTGVVLLHLKRMRQSEKFNRYLEPEVIDQLCEKFSFTGFIGDQDWWNLVVWDSPDLLHPLPCSFNFQTTEQFNTGPWKEQFPDYHACPGEVKVLHGHAIDGNKAKG